MEKAIYSILLGFHNMALVACVAGPFYMARIVKARSKYEKKIIYNKDRLMEDVISNQPIVCMIAIAVLYATGIGIPLVHLLIHEELKEMTTVGTAAFWLKQVLVLAMVSIQMYGTFYINPKLKELFAKFKDGVDPVPEEEVAFFALRGQRKMWCDRCLIIGILVLLVSPVLRWF